MKKNDPKTFQELLTHLESLIVVTIYRIVTYFCIVLVYGSAIYFESALMNYVLSVVQADAQRYPIIKDAVDMVRIVLGFLLIGCAIVHGFVATLSQLELDIEVVSQYLPFYKKQYNALNVSKSEDVVTLDSDSSPSEKMDK